MKHGGKSPKTPKVITLPEGKECEIMKPKNIGSKGSCCKKGMKSDKGMKY